MIVRRQRCSSRVERGATEYRSDRPFPASIARMIRSRVPERASRYYWASACGASGQSREVVRGFQGPGHQRVRACLPRPGLQGPPGGRARGRWPRGVHGGGRQLHHGCPCVLGGGEGASRREKALFLHCKSFSTGRSARFKHFLHSPRRPYPTAASAREVPLRRAGGDPAGEGNCHSQCNDATHCVYVNSMNANFCEDSGGANAGLTWCAENAGKPWCARRWGGDSARALRGRRPGALSGARHFLSEPRRA